MPVMINNELLIIFFLFARKYIVTICFNCGKYIVFDKTAKMSEDVRAFYMD